MSFLKGLFIVENPPKEEVTKKVETKTSFPTTSFPTEPIQVVEKKVEVQKEVSCTPYIEEVVKVYEEGFDSLNKDGYDFFEFFKAISKTGVDNAHAYEMAFTMVTSMDKSVTKESLLEQSGFYISELKKVYESYTKQGKSSIETIEKTKLEEGQTLTKSLQETRNELERLKKLEESQVEALSNIDSKYNTKLQEISCKLEANEVASSKLIGAIETVVNGIKTNIK